MLNKKISISVGKEESLKEDKVLYLKELFFNSDNLFHLLNKYTLDKFLVWDVELIESNFAQNEICRLLGHHEMGVCTTDFLERSMEPECLQNCLEQLQKGIANKKISSFEIDASYLHRNGFIVPINYQIFPLRNEIGIVTDLIAVFETREKAVFLENNFLKESRYENIVNAARLGTWEFNLTNDQCIFNDAWAVNLGYELSEIKTNSQVWLDIIHPNDYEYRQEILDQHLYGQLPYYECEVRMKHKNGDWIWILEKGQLISNDFGTSSQSLVGITQILPDKSTTLTHHRLFVDHAPSAIAMFDTDMRYLAVSNKFYKDYNIAHENIIGMSHYEVFPEIGAVWKSDHQRCLAGETLQSTEDCFVREDGTVQWVSWKLQPWFVEGDVIGGIIMHSSDITKIKKAEKTAKDRENFLTTILDTINVGIVSCDQNGVLTLFNKATKEWHGLPAKKVEQDELSKYYGLYDKDGIVPLSIEDVPLIKSLNGLNQREEITIIPREGKKRTVMTNGSQLKDTNGSVIGAVVAMHDITEIKEVEKELKDLLEVTKHQNDRLHNFTHIVSHNLKSHSGNLEMLLDIVLQENPQLSNTEIMQFFRKASKDLSETIMHLNEVVQINTTLVQNIIPLNVDQLLQKVFRNVKADIEESGITIINQISKTFEMRAVPAYLESILYNLIHNAIKYRSQSRESFVKVVGYEKDDYSVIAISDNGLGINLNRNREKVFGMYKTFHKNKNSRGIGLFITKNQIDAMGGCIHIDSKEERGTTFTIKLRKDEN